MLPTRRPPRALPTVLAVMLMAFATVTSHVQHALLRSKHWLVKGPALRAAYATAWAFIVFAALGAVQVSKWQWG